MFTRSVSPEQAPDKATYLEIDFEKGDPVALNGEKLSPASLLAQLNEVPTLHIGYLTLQLPLCAVLVAGHEGRICPENCLQEVAYMQPCMQRSHDCPRDLPAEQDGNHGCIDRNSSALL